MSSSSLTIIIVQLIHLVSQTVVSAFAAGGLSNQPCRLKRRSVMKVKRLVLFILVLLSLALPIAGCTGTDGSGSSVSGSGK